MFLHLGHSSLQVLLDYQDTFSFILIMNPKPSITISNLRTYDVQLHRILFPALDPTVVPPLKHLSHL